MELADTSSQSELIHICWWKLIQISFAISLMSWTHISFIKYLLTPLCIHLINIGHLTNLKTQTRQYSVVEAFWYPIQVNQPSNQLHLTDSHRIEKIKKNEHLSAFKPRTSMCHDRLLYCCTTTAAKGSKLDIVCGIEWHWIWALRECFV